YAFQAAFGDAITVASATPLGGPANPLEPQNPLDPIVELYDPSGDLVAADDNSAPDGRNGALSYTALSAGRYVARVRPAGGTVGQYLLRVGGNTAAPVPFTVLSSDLDNVLLVTAPS